MQDHQKTAEKKDVVYEGTITNEDTGDIRTYKGCTSNELKVRVSTHRSTFRDKDKQNSSEMAKEVHRIKEQTTNLSIKWDIIDQDKSHKAGDKFCKLCVLEKWHILIKGKPTDVNKFRLEPCLHKRKNFLTDIT